MKAVILTAGLGTRFLPITKVIPKALLPIGNKPVIHLLMEEILACNLEEIAIVISPKQEIIKKYFENNPDFPVKINFFIQEKALGDGNAILQAKDFLKDSPFAVLFGDDLIDSKKPALKQMIEKFQKEQKPILAIKKVPREDIPKYGIVSISGKISEKGKVKNLVEKPKLEDAPSNSAVIGKYVCTPETLTYLEKAEAGHEDGEIRIIDGFKAMLKEKKDLFALEIKGKRFDTGTPEGLLEAQIAFSGK